jgi:ABC-2 type transport system ATP-binding protein
MKSPASKRSPRKAQDARGPAAIRVEGARKVYPAEIGKPERVAVEEVSFSVRRGAIHGLLGPNGAGKTTTLKMLLGLVRATAGTFEILGAPSTEPEGRARVGFLAEQPYFPPQLTALQAMRLYGRLAGRPSKELDAESARLLDTVGLNGQERIQLSKFSRGMLQRLGLAQALLGAPDVLILDEPASGLDPIGQADVRNLMLKLTAHGTTILLSSHQLSEVEAVCDRVTILDRGRVVAKGRLDELLNTAGQTSIRAEGLAGLPESLSASKGMHVAAQGSVWIFSVPDKAVRSVVDAVDDAGGRVVSVMPKRESLEDYFARLLADGASGGAK